MGNTANTTGWMPLAPTPPLMTLPFKHPSLQDESIREIVRRNHGERGTSTNFQHKHLIGQLGIKVQNRKHRCRVFNCPRRRSEGHEAEHCIGSEVVCRHQVLLDWFIALTFGDMFPITETVRHLFHCWPSILPLVLPLFNNLSSIG